MLLCFAWHGTTHDLVECANTDCSVSGVFALSVAGYLGIVFSFPTRRALKQTAAFLLLFFSLWENDLYVVKRVPLISGGAFWKKHFQKTNVCAFSHIHPMLSTDFDQIIWFKWTMDQR